MKRVRCSGGNAAEGVGKIAFPHGIHIGGPPYWNRIDTLPPGATAPATTGIDNGVGDIMLTRDPATLGWVGWACTAVVSGTRTWKKFGQLEP